MSYKLFLDDERVPSRVTWITLPSNLNGDWVIVRTYEEFVATIERDGLPEFISFDHDLAEEHYVHGFAGTIPQYDTYKIKTGFHAALWLREYCKKNRLKVPMFTVHSMNRIGGGFIYEVLRS